ncbi:MAG: hypothetical protein LBR93_01330 [Treponema sp.]|jgi:hypothetical protein|nr:hypothetical protein [Treponema sp.]
MATMKDIARLAGAQVTAGGVFADIVRIARTLVMRRVKPPGPIDRAPFLV